ncbi:hypothetical protein [Clostridium beijerinckii]|uniref:hypothetical protein n=1 Tax=Clostridium beijerinckii TaxID=1520 RepID=UPI001361233D|nr:hypothetical protein [Clostridium beijerinckii]MZK54155.1 hypothetical protein [Clostridium beijerinckii]MZK62249.1 hypothetical protein [Clostridium beijerinckii]MZK72451.1 hypothetical protein [Clostridium beijerinckii]MZK77829.1 hypothetical protein [Clostridium beijerinckii]MZK87415.1 hypothetical protein [Clostridium beijerinckii]
MAKAKDLRGKVFGRLVAIEIVGRNKSRSVIWKCKCECGNECEVVSDRLLQGETKSCGCITKELNKTRRITHGLSHTKLYYVWKAMLARCNNKKHPWYSRYGGRGIKVCSEWEDVKAFYDWAINNGYKDGLEIDRVDNDGNYEPNNCKWKTRKEQTQNTSRNKKVTINGETKTLSEWAEVTGLNQNTLQYRYYRGDRGERLIRKIDDQEKLDRGVINA